MKMDYQAREDGRRGDEVREGGGQVEPVVHDEKSAIAMLAAMDTEKFCVHCGRKTKQHKFKGDWAREGGGRGGQGRGCGIMKSGCGRGQDAKGRGGRGAGGRNTFGGICSKCGRGAGGDHNTFGGICSKCGRGAGEDRKTFGWICFNCGKHGHKPQDNCPIWMKMLSKWHFQVYLLYTFDITIKFFLSF